MWSANGCVRLQVAAVKRTAESISVSIGIVARRRQLALTIDRRGRLAQCSHCCDHARRDAALRQVVSTLQGWPSVILLRTRVVGARATTGNDAYVLTSGRGSRAGCLRVNVGFSDGVELAQERPRPSQRPSSQQAFEY